MALLQACLPKACERFPSSKIYWLYGIAVLQIPYILLPFQLASTKVLFVGPESSFLVSQLKYTVESFQVL